MFNPIIATKLTSTTTINYSVIQGVSLILTLLKCKILGQKISNFFQIKFFFIVNFRTFCVVKTKFKNIYQFGRYSGFCENTQFIERYLSQFYFLLCFKFWEISLPYNILKAKINQKLLYLFILKQCLGMSGIFPNVEVLWIVIKLE